MSHVLQPGPDLSLPLTLPPDPAPVLQATVTLTLPLTYPLQVGVKQQWPDSQALPPQHQQLLHVVR